MIGKIQKETFLVDGNVLYFDGGVGYMSVCLSKLIELYTYSL